MAELSVSEQVMGDVRGARVSFEHDGERVPGTVFLPVEHDEPMPLVFIQHPLTSSKDDYFVREPSIMWARRGWVCVGLDAPYHGDPMSLMQDAETYTEAAGRYAEELHEAIELVAGRYPVDMSRLGFVGYSFGSAIGLPAVVADGRFKAAAFCLIGEGGVGGMPLGEFAAGLAGVAVRVVGKLQDEFISRESTEALYATLPGKKDITWLPGGHFEIGPDVVQAAGDWLKAEL
jgi:predicted esterase